MIRLTQLNNPRVAQAFIDYMATQGVVISQMPEGDGMFALWLHDEEQLLRAEQELTTFVRKPTSPPLPSCILGCGRKSNSNVSLSLS